MTDFEERLKRLGAVIYPTKCKDCVHGDYNAATGRYWCTELKRYDDKDFWCRYGYPHERAIERGE